MIKIFPPRTCICGLSIPHAYTAMTAHEFQCFKLQPNKVPAELEERFREIMAWEKRSEKAKVAARKRRKS